MTQQGADEWEGLSSKQRGPFLSTEAGWKETDVNELYCDGHLSTPHGCTTGPGQLQALTARVAAGNLGGSGNGSSCPIPVSRGAM